MVPRLALLVVFIVVLPCSPSRAQLADAHAAIQKYYDNVFSGPRTASKNLAVGKAAASLPGEVQGLVTKGILSYLNAPGTHTARELEAALSRNLSISQAPDESGIAAVVKVGSDQTYIVAYAVTTCASCSSSWIGVFRLDAGKYVLGSTLVNSAPDQTIHLANIGDQSVLMYGTNWGDAHNRLQVRLYSTTAGLRETWSLLNLPNGEIELEDRLISIRYRSSLLSEYQIVRKDYLIANGSLNLLNTRTYKDDQ